MVFSLRSRLKMIAENLYEQIFSSDEAFFEDNSSATSWQKKQRCMREKDAILKFRDRFLTASKSGKTFFSLINIR